jgi:hypothetical protein
MVEILYIDAAAFWGIKVTKVAFKEFSNLPLL